MNIVVGVKHVYGNRTVYPICQKAKNLARLAGTTTLTARAIQTIKELGYVIHTQIETI